jgi:hypothetical protein
MTKQKLSLILSVFIMFLCVLTIVNAADFTITKQAVNDVVAIELTIPARYDVTITNDRADKSFEFVSIIDTTILPKNTGVIAMGDSATVPVSVLPLNRVRYNFNFEYFVRDNFGNSVKDSMFVKILPIAEIISIDMPKEVARDDTLLPVRIINKENINLGDVVIIADAGAFMASTTIAIPANTAVTANIPLTGTKIKTSEAGVYPLKITLFLNNEYNYTVNDTINLKEFSSISTQDSIDRSFFGYTKILTRTNTGNIKQIVTIELPYANFIERTFTHFDILPTGRMQSKDGAMWQRELSPGESFTVRAITDYTVLIVIILLIIIAIVAYILVMRRRMVVHKKAIPVKTKGGEFASKIVILLKNVSGKEIMNLNLVDRLPLTTQLYEKFGSIKPDKTDKHAVEWNFPALLPGEEIVVSYVLYSKIHMVGAINLPTASLSFTDAQGKRKTVSSNKILVNAGN